MTGFATILLVCAGTAADRALVARALPLLAPGGRLHLLAALAPEEAAVPEVVASRRAGLQALAGTVAREAAERGARVDSALACGRRYLEIVRAAGRLAADLVIKAADPSPRPAVPLFASVDQHLLRKCPCPLWLLRPRAAEAAAGEAVVAAVDLGADDLSRGDLSRGEPGSGGDREADPEDGLNRRLLSTAGRLAAAGDRCLWLLHAWEDPLAEEVARWSSGPPTPAAAGRRQAAEAQAQARLEALAARARGWLAADGLPPLELRCELVAGPPRSVLPQAAAALGAEPLVLGTLSRGGLSGVLIGNTAEDLLNALDGSVLAVKPPGFVSPLLD